MKRNREGEIVQYKIKVGISNRHVHVTKETYELLFDEPLTVAKELNQIGEFASNQFVTLKGKKGYIDHVRIVGPFRHYNQVEICNSDAYILELTPPVRKSGDIKDSEDITLVGPKGEIHLKSVCILAQRHVHLNINDQKKFKVEDEQNVKINILGKRSAILDAHLKISDNGFLELHIDRDEANALLLKDGEEVILEI